jgi:hypothetical protein
MVVFSDLLGFKNLAGSISVLNGSKLIFSST